MDLLNRRINYLFILLICFFLKPYSIYSQVSDENINKIEIGFKLIEKFYDELLKEKLPLESVDILEVNYPLRSINNNNFKEEIYLWKYFKKNKALFLTERYTKERLKKNENSFYSKSIKVVSFYNINREKLCKDLYYQGILEIKLVSTISPEGVFKEITFPIIYDDNSKSYRIQWSSIKINGIIIDPYGELNRPINYDFYNKLGF